MDDTGRDRCRQYDGIATANRLAIRRTSPHQWTGLVVCAAGLLVACMLSLAIGTESVSPSVVWSALTDYTDRGDQWLVHDLRVPRTVLGLVVGVALGMSGALIQAVGRNPLADSQILGINSGASLFVVAAVSFLGLHSLSAYLWFAFAGAPPDPRTAGRQTGTRHHEHSSTGTRCGGIH